MFLRETDCTDLARLRFKRLFAVVDDRQRIEKTPHNAFQIRYLEAITSKAKFIHIVRDGVAVVQSIQRIATRSQY